MVLLLEVNLLPLALIQLNVASRLAVSDER